MSYLDKAKMRGCRWIMDGASATVSRFLTLMDRKTPT